MKIQNKKLLLVLCWIGGCCCVSAQGTIYFNTRVPGVVEAPVFGVDGQTMLEGDRYRAQLWAGQNADALQPLFPVTTFGTGENAGFVVPVGAVPVPGIPGGQDALVQLRLWDSFTGATWETAGWRGESNTIFVGPLGDPNASPSIPPANLAGLQGLVIVPEPSTLVLGCFGLSILMLVRVFRIPKHVEF